jgi:hypothetical protein
MAEEITDIRPVSGFQAIDIPCGDVYSRVERRRND